MNEDYLLNLILNCTNPLHIFVSRKNLRYATSAFYQYSCVLRDYYDNAEKVRKTKQYASPDLNYTIPESIKEIDF